MNKNLNSYLISFLAIFTCLLFFVVDSSLDEISQKPLKDKLVTKSAILGGFVTNKRNPLGGFVYSNVKYDKDGEIEYELKIIPILNLLMAIFAAVWARNVNKNVYYWFFPALLLPPLITALFMLCEQLWVKKSQV